MPILTRRDIHAYENVDPCLNRGPNGGSDKMTHCVGKNRLCVYFELNPQIVSSLNFNLKDICWFMLSSSRGSQLYIIFHNEVLVNKKLIIKILGLKQQLGVVRSLAHISGI